LKQYKKISNPIYQELKNLKLIADKDLVTLSNQTRDAKVKVIKDLKTNIIFLNKHITSKQYYSDLKYGDDDRKNIEKLKVGLTNVKTLSGNIKSEIIEDDYRRSEQFKNFLKNKDILDFGCGWGGFLKNVKNYKSLNGVELRNECISHVKQNIKRVKISNNINSFKKSFDIITMFHVLEHLPYQTNTLKVLKD
jgi:tRNA/tmRNA/rRNA uracil-C5-methylase (TrmA/RlmC/RlmD family)